MALDAQILLSILSHESSAGDISRTLRVTPASYSLVLSDGEGANQAQVTWSDVRTFPQGGEDSIPIRNLVDDRGTITMTSVKVLYIRNLSDTYSFILRAGAALQESWDGIAYSSDTGEPGEITFKPNGVIVFADPTAAGSPANASTDTIYFSSGQEGQSYEILLIGEGTIT